MGEVEVAHCSLLFRKITVFIKTSVYYYWIGGGKCGHQSFVIFFQFTEPSRKQQLNVNLLVRSAQYLLRVCKGTRPFPAPELPVWGYVGQGWSERYHQACKLLLVGEVFNPSSKSDPQKEHSHFRMLLGWQNMLLLSLQGRREMGVFQGIHLNSEPATATKSGRGASIKWELGWLLIPIAFAVEYS